MNPPGSIDVGDDYRSIELQEEAIDSLDFFGGYYFNFPSVGQPHPIIICHLSLDSNAFMMIQNI